jgi:PPPDE putative peptidase domain
MSRSLIGFQVDGIWHTGIVIYGTEYWFGPSGIKMGTCGSQGMSPVYRHESMTMRSPDEIADFLNYAQNQFRPDTYDLIRNNCNHFTNAFSRFLNGQGTPPYVRLQTQSLSQTSAASTLIPLVDSFTASMRSNQGSIDWNQIRTHPAMRRFLPLLQAIQVSLSGGASGYAVPTEPSTTGSWGGQDTNTTACACPCSATTANTSSSGVTSAPPGSTPAPIGHWIGVQCFCGQNHYFDPNV